MQIRPEYSRVRLAQRVGQKNRLIYFLLSLSLFSYFGTPSSISASRTSVSIVSVSPLSSLNPYLASGGLPIDVQVAYLNMSNLFYVTDKNVVTANTSLGTAKIVKTNPFTIEYQINPGRLWSDGLEISAEDLLLYFAICSQTFATQAKIGFSDDAKFKSNCYQSSFGDLIDGLPTLSSDKMKLTLTLKSSYPNWQTDGLKIWPIHALVNFADGRNTLPSLEVSKNARQRFVNAIYGHDTVFLSRVGEVWSNSYNLKSIDGTTNPNLLVGNGAYLVSSSNQNAINLAYNENYNSGPQVNGFRNIVFKVIPDGNLALQALKNREVDIYQSQSTADGAAAVKAISTANFVSSPLSIYEHIDLRIGPAKGTNTSYSGPFSGFSQRAIDLRTAFLLAFPRDEIFETLIKPVDPISKRLDSLLQFQGDSAYDKILRESGISKFTNGTQSSRSDAALTLVRKYFPTASPSNPQVNIKILWGTPSNSRRAGIAAIAKQALAKAGFNVEATAVTTWSTQLTSSNYDAAFFAWVKNPGKQEENSDFFCTSCNQNYSGYSSSIVDDAVKKLQTEVLSENDRFQLLATVEKNLVSDAVTLPLFQHPGIFGVDKTLENFKSSPYAPNFLWNFWEWSTPGLTPFSQPTPKPSLSPTPVITPSPSASNVTKPTTPTFSGVNFVGNKINVSVNIGSSANRPEKVYLVAPKLGFTSSNPSLGTINGSTASWTLDLNSLLGGTAIPLEIVGEKDGVKSEQLTGTYNVPLTKTITSAPAAPTKFSSRIVGNSALITTSVSLKENSLPEKVFLYSNSLGIPKSKSIIGEIAGDKALIELPIKSSMAGKKYSVSIYLTNSKGDSKPLVATISIPAPKITPKPKVTPKPGPVEPVICVRPNMTRVFAGACPPGWKKQSE